jgi:Domain of unknown function (DUF4279)
MSYDDDYATCEQTYASLRIYEVPPEEVTSALALESSETQNAGAKRTDRGRGSPDGWFLSSKGSVESRDVRRHLDWLLDLVMPQAGALRELRQRGAVMDLSCYWLSASGHGGPMISPEQATKLAALSLDCWFDVYFIGDDQ